MSNNKKNISKAAASPSYFWRVSQLNGEALHQSSVGPSLLKQVVECVHGAVLEVLPLVVHGVAVLSCGAAPWNVCLDLSIPECLRLSAASVLSSAPCTLAPFSNLLSEQQLVVTSAARYAGCAALRLSVVECRRRAGVVKTAARQAGQAALRLSVVRCHRTTEVLKGRRFQEDTSLLVVCCRWSSFRKRNMLLLRLGCCLT